MDEAINANEIPEILYHYCSGEAFYGIITGKAIWQTSIFSMNDYAEGNWFFRVLKNELIRRPEEYGVISGYLDNFIHQPSARKQIRLTCFSKVNDSVSQWVQYAADGTGFVIGFNPKKLSGGKKMRQEPIYEPKNFVTPLQGWGEVNYDINYHKQKAREIIDAVSAMDLLNEELARKGPDDTEIALEYDIRKHAILTKNPAFDSEQEWRLVSETTILDGDSWRWANNSLQPYGVLSLQTWIDGETDELKFSDDPDLDVSELLNNGFIKEVWLGPKNRSNPKIVEKFLTANGFYPHVGRSIATYF